MVAVLEWVNKREAMEALSCGRACAVQRAVRSKHTHTPHTPHTHTRARAHKLTYNHIQTHTHSLTYKHTPMHTNAHLHTDINYPMNTNINTPLTPLPLSIAPLWVSWA